MKFLIVISLLGTCNLCIIKKWQDRPYVKPSMDLLSSKTTTAINLVIRHRPLSDLVYNDRCGVVILAPSLDPSELNVEAQNLPRNLNRHRWSRIVSGEHVNANSWPWVIGIYIREHGEMFFRCAGALIDERYVLTSAYCVASIPVSHLTVAAGSSVLSSGRFYSVHGVRAHKEYSNQNQIRNNDIALLRLKKSVAFSESLNTICMPPSIDHTVVYNKNVVVAGWGSTDGVDSPASMSKYLVQSILTVFNEASACDEEATHNKYCAYKRASKDSNVCWHDLGAPLMFYQNNRWYIYGIASSFGVDASTNECTPSTPSYYTSVPVYLDWIAYTIEEFVKEDD